MTTRHTGRISTPSRLAGVLQVALALSRLTMPVTYRGGSEAAHAHAVFQLWSDVETGSFTHHRDAEPADTADHGGHVGHNLAQELPRRDVRPLVEVDEDAPTLSSQLTPTVHGLAGVLPGPRPSLLIRSETTVFYGTPARLIGQGLDPLDPPPRAT